jgi:hypothetical protein
MKKRKLTIFDIGRLPTVTSESTPRYGLKQFTEQYDREQQEIALRPLREAEAKLNQAAREANSRLKKFFSLPVAEIQEFPLQTSPIDTLGDYPTRSTSGDFEEVKAQANSVLWEFQKYLTERGCELNGDGWTRYIRYCLTSVLYDNVEASIPTFQKMLDRLMSLGCFAAGEITGYVAPAKPQPVEQPSQDINVGKLAESLPSDSPQWRKLVSQGFEGETLRWFYAWTESLKKNFDYDFPVEALAVKAGEYLTRWNLSPFRYDSYDKLRLAWVKQGIFPSHLITKSEALAQLIEDADLNNLDVRRDIGMRHREIIAAGPPLPAHK